MRACSPPSGPSVRGAPSVPRPDAPSFACGWQPGLLPARARPVALPPRHTLRAAGRRSPAARRRGSAPPFSLLTARLRRGCSAYLLLTKLGDLRGAVELLREVLAAARANPDMGPAHAKTEQYAKKLAEWEAQL